MKSLSVSVYRRMFGSKAILAFLQQVSGIRVIVRWGES